MKLLLYKRKISEKGMYFFDFFMLLCKMEYKKQFNSYDHF
jgi:hypothetical protein